MHDVNLADFRELNANARESRSCLMEWMDIISQGIFPSEQSLECLLDHIERAP